MTKHIREIVSTSGIENVSRRGVLKGILSTTGLVLAVHVLPSRPALADDAPKWGADGMPHGTVNNPLGIRFRLRPTEPSPSSAIAPRWGRACAPACR